PPGGRGDGSPRGQAVRERGLAQLPALGEDVGTAGAGDRPVDAPAAPERGVGGVDGGVGALRRGGTRPAEGRRGPLLRWDAVAGASAPLPRAVTGPDELSPRLPLPCAAADASPPPRPPPPRRCLTASSPWTPPAPGPVPPPLPAC